LRAVETRAARDLTHVSVDTAVDRSHLIKLGYVLVAVLVLFAAYVFILAQNPLPSIGRVIAPWGNIDRPSRVTIEDTKHTPAEVFRGQRVTVSTLVHGLGEDEQVTLYWSTADGQVSDEALAMHRENVDARHRATVPANDENGLRQDISYWIGAGDARTSRVDVTVLEELFINVDEVRYEYPAYTGKQPASQTHGDIRAVEGTTVTIVATANQAIRDAHLDFDCDGTMDELASQVEGNRAEFRFPLALRGKDRQIEQSTYWVRFFTEQDRENVKPVKQRIEVLPDWPPEVNIVEPQRDRLEAAPNARLNLRLRARDNDYGLDQVGFVVEKGDQRLATVPLLKDQERPHLGEAWLERSWVLELGKYTLQPGDVVHVFAEATDNKQPRGQRRSSRQKIEIVILEPQQPKRDEQNIDQPQDQQAQDGVQPKQPDMRQPDQQPDKQPTDGDQPQQGEPQQGGMGENGGMQNPNEGAQSDQNQGGMSDKPMNGGEQGMSAESGANGGEQGTAADAQPKDGMEQSDGMSGGNGQKSNDPNAQPNSGESTENGEMGSGAAQDRPINPHDDRDVIDKLNEHREQQQTGQSSDSRSKGGMNDEGMAGTSGMEPSGSTSDKPKDDAGNPEKQQGGMAEGEGQKKDATNDPMSQEGMSNAEQSGDMTRKPINGEQPSGTGGMDPKNGGEKQPMKSDDMSNGEGGMKPKDQPQGSPTGDEGGNSGGMKPDQKNPMSEGMDGAKPAPGDESQMSKGEGMGEQKNDGNVDQKKKGQGNQADDEGHGKRDGEGTAGDSTSKDEGAGRSEEQGTGETSDMVGDDKQAKGETGKSDASKMGEGSQREGTGDQQGGKPSKEPDSAKSPMSKDFDDGSPDKQPGDGTSGKPDKQAQKGKPNEFGGEKEGQMRTDAPDQPPPAGDDDAVPDEQRREYARKATELALDHLKEELAKGDSDLFDKDGGLTREQAEAWARRMEEILKNAEKAGNQGEAKQKLDQVLDNLGIRPQRSAVGRGTARDQFRDVRRGVDIPPPPGYEEHDRAYKKAISEGAR
jgi:collagen type III alpha